MSLTTSESSLPTQSANTLALRSSPPSIGLKRSYSDMDINQRGTLGAAGDDAPSMEKHQRRGSSVDTARPQSGQRRHEESQNEAVDHNDEMADDDIVADESNPAQQIADFDWTGLEERYHLEIKRCESHEENLMKEFESLMSFFRVWAVSGHTHETERTYSRLKTRMMHVQHSEEELEKKRLHYISVVDAFERALKLLSGAT
ncbi:hypothetical protein K491DRAFT_686172 [Lophiostoma macrostomum CBS 122681]|uniref:Uncharacterized protein n=1 Tax=Lophiostoma macrostomum CBS 122681 TaxID=1314788 RepID=A0A6A6TVK2_9PLEO|nr:hypothetical protein K491DRAFT_686172 [Lophiostoma macrostomum CBS 122681]